MTAGTSQIGPDTGAEGESFDYLIVGSGAAGAVLANRLSADPTVRVCVLEAGPTDSNRFIRVPAGYVKTLTDPGLTWQFHSEPAEGSAMRAVYLPQGHVLGGSTAVNGLVYNRGQAADFDHWASLGNPGWSYEEVLPYFRRTETRIGGDPRYRGTEGPFRISDPQWRDPICEDFIEALAAMGVPKHIDYNGESQRGVGYFQRFIDRGKRVTVADAYVKPVRSRPNLVIRTESLVTEILLDGKRAVGVRYRPAGPGRSGNQPIILRARRELIVSAGTVNSAKLLQLSGIGPGPLLQSLGIEVKHDLAGVGENFQDHYFVRIAARLKDGTVTLNQRAKGWRLAVQLARWSLGLPSIIALSPSVSFAFLNSTDLGETPDLQFVFTPGSYRPGRVYELDDFPAATCGFTQQRPRSVGHIRITSADPGAMPTIQPNYLQHPLDQEVTVNGIRLARRFLQAAPLNRLFEREETPGAELQSDAELLDFARETGNTGYHLVGSCTMGPSSDPMAVVSPELAVHGIDGLRVIDASVMPTVTSSNTCAATLMIAERGADLLLAAAKNR